MLFMNEYDIDEAVRFFRTRHPELAPYAEYLSEWRHIANRSSDGWAYWPKPARAARKLMELVEETMRASRWNRVDAEVPTESQFKRALSPIKACATREGLDVPQLAEVAV